MFKRPKTSYWIRKTHLLRRDEYVCASCGARADKAYKNCPGCGAVMKGTRSIASWTEDAEILDD